MKIRSIAVKELKKFDTPAQITGIDDYLNIISGPNEMGKSTILSALRAAFFSRHSSKARDIRNLQNSQNLGAPVVKVEFDVNGKRYQIRKQFVKQRLAELSLPDGRVFRGDAAEDELQRLISFGESVGAGQSADMWNLFWVEQGKSYTPISVSDNARSSLHVALEAEVGKVLGGRRGRELPRNFLNQREKFVTRTGRERGEFQQLSKHIEVLHKEISDLEQRRDNLFDCLNKYEQCKKELDRLEHEEIDQQTNQELKELRSKDEEMAKLDLKIKAAESDLNRVTERLSVLEKETQTRIDLGDEAKEVDNSRSTTSDQLKDWQQKSAVIQSERDDQLLEVKRLNDKISVIDKNVRGAEEELALANEFVELIDLESRLGQTQNLIQQCRKFLAEAKTIVVTDDDVERIKSAKSKLDVAKATIKANATRITFDLKSEGAKGITIDGHSIDSETYEFETVSHTAIEIPERGLISVTPAVQDETQLLESERIAITEYEDALRSANAKSLEEAINLGLKRETIRQRAEEINSESRNRLPEVDRFGGSIEAVEEYVKQQQKILKNSVNSRNLSEPPKVATAQAWLDELKSVQERLRPDLKQRQDELDQTKSRLAETEVQLARIQEKHNHSKDRLVEIKAHLKQLDDTWPMGEIEAEKGQLIAHKEKLSVELDVLNKKFSESDIEIIRVRIGRLEQKLKNRDSERNRLHGETKYLIGQIEMFEGTGIDEDIENKRRELETAQAQYKQMEQEVAILDLLIKTLGEAEDEAKEKFLSPVLTRIKPYLGMLFPGADLGMDENLEIVEIKRQYGESFDNLSIGTQEQIAVLVRLTFAAMLVEQGKPATVILDDALVFSDEGRMETMFDILSDISRTVQIIILTCRKSLFEGLGGNVLSLKYPSDI